MFDPRDNLAGTQLEAYLPQIREIIQKKEIPENTQQEAELLKDKDTLREIFSKAFAYMPRQIESLVTHDQFVDFCMRHKDQLIRIP